MSSRNHATRFFFFNDTATTEIYSLSLHDALPISASTGGRAAAAASDPTPLAPRCAAIARRERPERASRRARDSAKDRKSTRLNSSHANISYAVFCLEKKKN